MTNSATDSSSKIPGSFVIGPGTVHDRSRVWGTSCHPPQEAACDKRRPTPEGANPGRVDISGFPRFARRTRSFRQGCYSPRPARVGPRDLGNPSRQFYQRHAFPGSDVDRSRQLFAEMPVSVARSITSLPSLLHHPNLKNFRPKLPSDKQPPLQRIIGDSV